MFIYISKSQNLSSPYIALEEALNPTYYPNLGNTLEDYNKGEWVLLSQDQVKFLEDNPKASVEEVWKMELDNKVEKIRTLEDAKKEKLSQLNEFDTSDKVNAFTINGALTAWFSVQERLNYKQSVEAAKMMKVDKLSFYVGNNILEVETDKAAQMLASLQLYADACFMTTKAHMIKIESLQTIVEVDNYDFTTDYPEKLNFNLISA